LILFRQDVGKLNEGPDGQAQSIQGLIAIGGKIGASHDDLYRRLIGERRNGGSSPIAPRSFDHLPELFSTYPPIGLSRHCRCALSLRFLVAALASNCHFD
jgi:hypothetical protein